MALTSGSRSENHILHEKTEVTANQLRLCRVRHKRKTFGSVLVQNGMSTAVVQRLLEHSSPDLTNKIYTNVDPVLRHALVHHPVFLFRRRLCARDVRINLPIIRGSPVVNPHPDRSAANCFLNRASLNVIVSTPGWILELSISGMKLMTGLSRSSMFNNP